MGFFATFWTWLNGQLSLYIGNNVATLAAALEPAVVTLGTVYVMIWGYLHLTGKIDEPVLMGLKRIAVLALIFGVGLRLWLYNSLLVDAFYNAPAQLAAAVVGAADPVATIDAIWASGGTVAGALWEKGWSLTPHIESFVAALLVWSLMGLLCVYAMFLIALSSIALSVLLALGPLFIAMTLFDATRRFFVAWISQLANYAFITLLTVMIGALLLQLVQTFASQTAARGGDILTVDALNMLLVAVLVFLVLRQIMPIAAALAGGASLGSHGAMSRPIGWAARSVNRATKIPQTWWNAKMIGSVARTANNPAESVYAASAFGQQVYRAGRTGNATQPGSLSGSWRQPRT